MTKLQEISGFAVDLGGTKIAVARFESGAIVDRRRLATNGEASPEALVGAIAEALTDMGYIGGQPLGMATAGMVDAAGNWHAVNLNTLQKVQNVPLRAMIADRLGPATVLNDADAATLAEARCGAGRSLRNFAFVTVSTGVGGGLILNGQLHQTPDGIAGNIGFLSSSYASVVCGSGRHGTVESVASGKAIARAARDAGYPEIDAREVFRRAQAGEKLANDIIDISAAAIADLCADLRAALGLEAVFLGGSVGFAEGYLDRVEYHLSQLPRLFRCPVRPAELGQDGPLVGALLACVEG